MNMPGVAGNDVLFIRYKFTFSNYVYESWPTAANVFCECWHWTLLPPFWLLARADRSSQKTRVLTTIVFQIVLHIYFVPVAMSLFDGLQNCPNQYCKVEAQMHIVWLRIDQHNYAYTTVYMYLSYCMHQRIIPSKLYQSSSACARTVNCIVSYTHAVVV